MGDAVLHLGRMLGRREHVHVAGLAGRREGDLAFEIEMVLAAAAHLAGQPVRGLGEAGGEIAAGDRLRRADIVLARDRLLDGQDCGQRLIGDGDELRRRARLVERRRRHRGHRLAGIGDAIGGEQRLVAADRRDVVLARDVRGGDDGDDARSGAGARAIDRENAGVRVGAEHQRGFERAARGRDIVDIERLARDMAAGAVVADGGVHAAADAREGRRHNASNRMGTVGLPVSSRNRRTRPAAARRR